MKKALEFSTKGGKLANTVTTKCEVDFEGAGVNDLIEGWLSWAVIKVQGQIRAGSLKPADVTGIIKWNDFAQNRKVDVKATVEAAVTAEKDRIRLAIKAILASNPDFDAVEVADLVIAGKTQAEVEEELG